jgi:hypothetical protein
MRPPVLAAALERTRLEMSDQPSATAAGKPDSGQASVFGATGLCSRATEAKT